MCNLYRLNKGVTEIAKLFAVEPDLGANVASELYPGYPRLVVAEGRARAMHWGFPLVLKGKQGQPLKPKPVTNARDDKLLTGFWRESFVSRRCLVLVTQWAEPQGQAGRMTRTWYALPGVEVLAVAGLWRHSPEWGAVYTMVMTESSVQMADVHDRMPVILDEAGQRACLQGSADAALALCQTWAGALAVEVTEERWAGGGAAPSLL